MLGAVRATSLAAPSCETQPDLHVLLAHRLAELLAAPRRDVGRREQLEPPRLLPRPLLGGKLQRFDPLYQHVEGAG